jgi:hypothetical protein
MHLTRFGGRYGCFECVIVESVEAVEAVDVDEIMVPRGGGWDANQLAGRFGDAARTGDGWTASPTRSLIRAQNSDWGWCGDATAMPENLPGATTLKWRAAAIAAAIAAGRPPAASSLLHQNKLHHNQLDPPNPSLHITTKQTFAH